MNVINWGFACKISSGVGCKCVLAAVAKDPGFLSFLRLGGRALQLLDPQKANHYHYVAIDLP